ncbi:hypothetical protein Droror1_Dr00026433 [Drosera rotundifolia]
MKILCAGVVIGVAALVGLKITSFKSGHGPSISYTETTSALTSDVVQVGFVFVAAEYETSKNSLNQEYNMLPSAGNEKNYFIGRFESGLPTFGTKKKSSDTGWTLQKEGLQGRQVTDTLKV